MGGEGAMWNARIAKEKFGYKHFPFANQSFCLNAKDASKSASLLYYNFYAFSIMTKDMKDLKIVKKKVTYKQKYRTHKKWK